MAKRGKLNLDQIESLKDMSLEQIQGAVNDQMRRGPTSSKEEPTQASQQADSQLVPYDEDTFIQKYLDPATLESRPEYANGSSPASAINKSPLSLVDRMKMSIGDEKGKLNFLKEKYSEVQPMRSGSLAVKDKDGMWYQVDPDGAGQGDAWDRTKEIAKDILGDYAGTIGTTAAVIGATAAAPATGGASLVAAGAAGLGAALTRTSLGRLIGTYDATPEEQLKDVALETVLNVGGQAFALGIKPTAQVVGSMFKKGAQTLKGLPEESINILAKAQGNISGVGEDVAQTWIRNSDEVGQALLENGKGAVSSEAVTQNLLQKNIANTKAIANETRAGLSKWYATNMDEVIKEAGGKFNPSVSSSVKESLSEYAEKGFGEMLPNGTFKLKPLKELLSMQQASGNVSVISDPKGYRLLKDFVNDVNRYAAQADQVGKDGVRQFIAFEQQLGQKIRELSLDAAESGGKEIIDLFKNVKASIQNKIMDNTSKSLASAGVKKDVVGMFGNIQKQYSTLKDALNPILDAHTSAIRKGSSDAYANLYNNLFKVSSLSPKGSLAKGSLDTALFALGEFSPNIAKNVQQIAVNKAAAASLPLTRGGFLGQSSVGLLTTPLTSPRLNFQSAKLAGSALKGLEWMKSLDPNMKTQLFQDPKALSQFMSTVVNTPMVQDSVKNDLMGQVLGGQGATQ